MLSFAIDGNGSFEKPFENKKMRLPQEWTSWFGLKKGRPAITPLFFSRCENLVAELTNALDRGRLGRPSNPVHLKNQTLTVAINPGEMEPGKLKANNQRLPKATPFKITTGIE
jgi:hypothetical protein